MPGKLPLCAIVALLLTICYRAEATTLVDSLTMQLANARTPADSITLLYNIYDNSTGDVQKETFEKLYKVSLHTNNENMTLDVLRMGANLNANSDSLLDELTKRAHMLPASDNQRGTIAFINVKGNARRIHALPEDIRNKRLRHYLSLHNKAAEMDEYERIEYLFNLCAYLSTVSEGDLLIKYLSELQELIDKLPSRDLYLRSLFYTQAAVCYLNNNMYTEADEANNTILDIIEQFEKQDKAMGRLYRNYDRTKYICYRSLLKCRPVLNPDDADLYYEKIKDLAKTSADIQQDFELHKRPTIYYLMAKKRYSEALPLIIERLDAQDNSEDEYRYLVEALIEAADATGDKKNLLRALHINNSLLKKRIDEKALQSYKELQFVYDVNVLKQENDDLAMANQRIIIKRHNEQLTYAFIGLLLLLLMLMVVILFYRRTRRLSVKLAKSNAVIAGERDALKRAQKELIEARDRAKAADRIKTDFVNNMSREIQTPLAAIAEYANVICGCADENKREYIKRFSDIIELNTDMLLTIANDVLDQPSLESAKNAIHIKPSSAKEICRNAVSTLDETLKPDVKFIFVKDELPDIELNTDSNRIEQVLKNLLSNAIKFTDNGQITLSYKLVNDNKHISFEVSDTGIGIPHGKEEVIFSQFEKLDSTTPGSGLGLYLSRLMARLLKGDLILDHNYHNGSRFVLTIPIKYETTQSSK